MKKFIVATLFTAILFSGCASKVNPFDYDPAFDTSRLETFTLKEEPSAASSVIEAERIRGAIERVLFAKGYSEASDLGDFTVLYGVRILKNRPSPITFGLGIGGISGNFAGSISTAITPKHDDAIISIKLVDPATNRIFWSGSVTKNYSGLNPSQKDAAIQEAVDEILLPFPKRGETLKAKTGGKE
ncbi:MAG: DUF4136 domain-containing protein [Hydrogenimonas sp.]|nr:DUF4136 domain-containing protein [Hydrogenimonas sp.]